jgi:hypothetical protein
MTMKTDNTRPPPLLLPVSPLAEPANTSVSLPLQLMKTTVLAESSNLLSFFIIICAVQRCLRIVAR